MVKYKNNESDAFMYMLANAKIDNDAIFYADAINTRAELISYLNNRGMDFIFAIKNNLANKSALNAMKQFLEEHPDGHEYFLIEQCKKESKRIEQRFYDIVPVSAFSAAEQLGFKDNTKTIIRVRKVAEEHLKDDNKNIREGKIKEWRAKTSTFYYISSLEFNELNCAQIVHSLKKRWLYETQHNTLDTVFLQDYQSCCDDNHLSSIIGLNSIVYNVTTFARQKMSQRGYSLVVHRNAETAARAPLVTYKRVFSTFRHSPLVALEFLYEYFSTPPTE